MSVLRLWLVVALTLALFVVVACDDDTVERPDPQPDVTQDTIQPDDVPAPDDIADPSDADETAPEVDEDVRIGEVRPAPDPFEGGATAFVAESAGDLFEGPLAAGVLGDVVLRNEHVRFVVRNEKRSLFSPYSGALVDADLVREEGEPGQDHFLELFPMTGFGRVFKPDSMEIVDDGYYSGTAVVRFTGTEGGMTLIDSLVPTAPLGIEATLEYILEPDARHLEIITTVRNPSEWNRTLVIGQILQFGDRLERMIDGCGEDLDCLMAKSDTRFIAAEAGHVSYGYAVPTERGIKMMLAQRELMLLEAGQFTIASGEEASLRQYFIVGDGTVEDVVAQVKELREEPPGIPVELEVTLGDEYSALEDVRILVERAGAPAAARAVTRTRPAPDGTARLHLEPGSYEIKATLPGSPGVTVSDVEVGESPGAPIAVALPAAGHLRVQVSDGEGDPLIASLVLQSGHDAAWGAGRRLYEAIHHGDRTIPVAAGDYTATVSRGLVWDIDRQNITVSAGEVAHLEAQISQAVDTTGYLMMNSHEHCEHSIDSSVPVEDRVYNAVAVGVDVMLPTDHDFFLSHQGTIERLGLEDQVVSFTGCEVSPVWGHTTIGGCVPPAYDTYYAVEFTLYDDDGNAVRALSATEIFEQARNDFQCEFIAINHPYRGGPMFATYGIDGTSDPADALPDLDLGLVDALEVYNKNDNLDRIMNENLPAWFNLLNRGYQIAAIGGSDEHGYNGNYGNPRNMVMAPGTVQDENVQSNIFDNIKAFRNIVLGGPVIELTVEGAGLGEVATAIDGMVSVSILVQAPPWMGLNFVEVYKNGVLVREFDPDETHEVVRLDKMFDLEANEDGHLVVVAGSTDSAHDMTPVSSKLPLSITNPVFIDSDGLGYKAIHADGAPWD